MLKQFILDQSLIHWPPCGLGEQGPSPNIKLKLIQVGILVDDQTFSIGRFHTRDAISVWDELGQTMFSSSGYASCSSSRVKTGTRRIIRP